MWCPRRNVDHILFLRVLQNLMKLHWKQLGCTLEGTQTTLIRRTAWIFLASMIMIVMDHKVA
jgi:hypothetical protein